LPPGKWFAGNPWLGHGFVTGLMCGAILLGCFQGMDPSQMGAGMADCSLCCVWHSQLLDEYILRRVPFAALGGALVLGCGGTRIPTARASLAGCLC